MLIYRCSIDAIFLASMTTQRSKKIIRHWQQDTPEIDEREMANAQTKDLCCKHGRVLNTLSTLPAAGCLDGSNHERRAIKAFVEQCCTGIPTPIVLSVIGKEYM